MLCRLLDGTGDRLALDNVRHAGVTIGRGGCKAAVIENLDGLENVQGTEEDVAILYLHFLEAVLNLFLGGFLLLLLLGRTLDHFLLSLPFPGLVSFVQIITRPLEGSLQPFGQVQGILALALPRLDVILRKEVRTTGLTNGTSSNKHV